MLVPWLAVWRMERQGQGEGGYRIGLAPRAFTCTSLQRPAPLDDGMETVHYYTKYCMRARRWHAEGELSPERG